MTSKYLKDIIKADYLLKGHLAVGAKLPTVRALAEREEVSPPPLAGGGNSRGRDASKSRPFGISKERLLTGVAV